MIVWNSRPQMIVTRSLDDEEEPEREQHLVEVAAVADRMECRREDDAEADAEDERDHGREDERQPLVLDKLVSEVRAEKVEAPVRQVDHVEHPEDQREPDRQHEDQHPERDAVEDAREVLVEEVRGYEKPHCAASLSLVVVDAKAPAVSWHRPALVPEG